MGKLLVSGHGKDFVKSTAIVWVLLILIAGGAVALGFFLANEFGYDATLGLLRIQVRTGLYYVFAFGGIVIAAVIICYSVMQDISTTKTKIFVYENGIKGAGGGPKFTQSLEDTVTISSFELTYDQIASVDITNKKFVSVNSFGKTYVIAVVNADQIVTIINGKLRQTTETNKTESTEAS